MLRYGGRLLFLIGCLWLLLQSTLPSQVASQQSSSPRLYPSESYGGNLNSTVLLNNQIIAAEGESLIWLTPTDSQNLMVTQRHTLNYGTIQDLAVTNTALYVLTPSHLITLSFDGQHIIHMLEGGGSRLTLFQNWLAVVAQQGGVRLFQLQADGAPLYQQTLPTSSQTEAVTFINETLIATADSTIGLRLTDIQDTTQPQVQSLLVNVAPTQHVVAFDRLVYVSSNHHLYIVNAQDPQQPQLIGHYAPIHDLRDMVWLNSQTIVIADQTDGIKIYQLNADKLPTYLNSQDQLPAYALGYDAPRQLLFSAQADGVQIYDASQLPRFVPFAFIPLWSSPRSITPLDGQDMVLIALGAGGIAVVDVRNPQSPQVVAALPFSGGIQQITPHLTIPTLFYLTMDDGRLVTLQLDPRNPATVTTTAMISLSGLPDSMVIHPQQQYLAVATGKAGLQIFSLRDNPQHPQWIGEIRPQSTAKNGITQVDFINRVWFILEDGYLRWFTMLNDQIYPLGQYPTAATSLLIRDNTILLGGKNELQTLTYQQGQLTLRHHYQGITHINDIAAYLGQAVVLGNLPQLIFLDTLNPQLPREQRVLMLPITSWRFVNQGDTWLLYHPSNGLHMFQFPLLLASQVDVMPQWSGYYRPNPPQRSLLPDATASESLIIIQDGEDTLVLNPDHTVSRLAASGASIATNRQVIGTAVTLGNGYLWVVRHDGYLYALDPQTLTVAFTTSLNIPASTLQFHQNQLWIGTRDGTLLSIVPPTLSNPTPTVIAQRDSLGDAIYQLRPLSNGDLLVSAGKGGLWRITPRPNGEIQTINHLPIAGEVHAADHLAPWTAVASGSCGLQIFKDNTLYAASYAHAVHHIFFEDENHLITLAGGIPTRYTFNPDGVPDSPPAPTSPIPLSNLLQTASLSALSWQLSESSCQPLTFEVWINQTLAGTTTTAIWPLNPPPNKDFTWQIVVLDQYGNRTVGPEWRVLLPLHGWANTPSTLPPIRATTTQESPPIPIGVILGVTLLLISIAIISRLTQSRRSVY